MFDSIKIQQTDRIIFPSLLINFMGSSMNYPVFRDGIIALIPEEKVPLEYKVGRKLIKTKQRMILVDATSVQGASGSPIFLWPGPRIVEGAFTVGGNKPYLLGIMHGFYPAYPREVYEVETSESKTMFRENSGIALIFPSWKLLDILNHKKTKDRMNEIIKLQGTN